MLKHLPAALPAYTLVALAGFVADCSLFATLHLLAGVPPLPANLVSAAAAVTLVYFASARRIFLYQGHLLLPKFIAYLAYQATVILLFSAFIAGVSATFTLPALAVKIAVVPVQFILNYLILRELLKRFERP